MAMYIRHTYQIVVGNIGTVWAGHSESEALVIFEDYADQSQLGEGRAANEPVVLMEDGEIKAEYTPS